MMKLFTVGPVEMYPQTLDISGTQLPYFRTQEFSDIMLDSERLLKELIGAQPSSKVAFLTASGTGAMDAAVSNFFTGEDRVLVISGGSFGHRFEEICEVYGIPFDAVRLEFGHALSSADLDPFRGKGYNGLLVNIDETSTGQLYDIRILSEFCKAEGAYLIVDAISSFLADSLDMTESGIDAVILSSQKALALSPGISIVIMSDRLYGDRIEGRTPQCYYLSIRSHVENQKRGQTPFTPAVGILLELNAMLRQVQAMGLSEKIGTTRRLAEGFRAEAVKLGLRIPDYPLSNAVTPVMFEKGAYDVFLKLKDEYGIVVTPSGGDLKDKLLRVGHIGNLKESDYVDLIRAMKEVME